METTSLYFYRHALLRGFEIPILVLFLSSLEGETNDLFFSRCKSRLIIVCKEEDAEKLDPRGGAQCDFTNQIPIFGRILIIFVCLDLFLLFHISVYQGRCTLFDRPIIVLVIALVPCTFSSQELD